MDVSELKDDLKALELIKDNIRRSLQKIYICDNCIKKYLLEDCDESDFSEDTMERRAKKAKTVPCTSCLDLLSQYLFHCICREIRYMKISENYKYETFNIIVTLPKAIKIREHSINIFLKDKFPSFYAGKALEVFTKHFVRCIYPRIAQIINMTYDQNAAFTLIINLGYKEDFREIQILINSYYRNSREQPRRVKHSKLVGDLLVKIKDHIFKKFVGVPPDTAINRAYLSLIEVKEKPIFLIGKYQKFSRTLPQTSGGDYHGPTIIGKIYEGLLNVLPRTPRHSLSFHPTGREDVNVRVLGDGRLFYIEITQPHMAAISQEKLREVEEKINNNAEDMKVTNLEMTTKTFVASFPTNFEKSQVSYDVLCKINSSTVVEELIRQVNENQITTVMQKTPIRLMHKKSLDAKMKKIINIQATPIPDDPTLFQLSLTVENGLQIQEFVNGDMGRTQPNLSSIIGSDIEIVAVDIKAFISNI